MSEPQGETTFIDKRTTAAVPVLQEAVATHGKEILQNEDFKAAVIAAFSGKNDKTRENIARIAHKLTGSMKLSDYLGREVTVDPATNELLNLIQKHTNKQSVDYIGIWRELNKTGLYDKLDQVQQSYFRKMGSRQLQRQTNERPVVSPSQIPDAPPIS